MRAGFIWLLLHLCAWARACPLLLNYQLATRRTTRGRTIADAGDPREAREAEWDDMPAPAEPAAGPAPAAEPAQLAKKLRGRHLQAKAWDSINSVWR